MNKKGQTAIIVAIIGVIGVIIGVYLHQTDFFTSADIRFIRQGELIMFVQSK